MATKTALLEKLTIHTPHLSSRVSLPAFLYGTAWKKEATTELVFQALSNGFTAIDTACQPKHYREDLVGEGLRKAIAETSLKRADVYIQTKFTSIHGQDPNNIPYDPKRPVKQQVRQSIERSLRHFDMSKVSETPPEGAYIDTVVLHAPMRDIDETMEVWHTLEEYVPQRIHNIGISNCDLFTLMNVYENANIKPSVVQNRFYPQTKFDNGVRKFCNENNVIYQSFWTLSANRGLIKSRPVQELVSQLRISQECALYCLVLGLGNLVILNGTTRQSHMKSDWASVEAAKNFAISNPRAWKEIMDNFKGVIKQPLEDV